MAGLLVLCLVCQCSDLTRLYSRSNPVLPLPLRQLVVWLWASVVMGSPATPGCELLPPTCSLQHLFLEPTYLGFGSFKSTTLEPKQS